MQRTLGALARVVRGRNAEHDVTPHTSKKLIVASRPIRTRAIRTTGLCTATPAIAAAAWHELLGDRPAGAYGRVRLPFGDAPVIAILA